MLPKLAGALACTAFLASTASGDIIEFNFFLSGDQEVPPADTDATGAGTFLYDTDTQTFDIQLQVFGIGLDDLMGVGPNETPVHIHLAPAGANGPIVIDLGFVGEFEEDNLGIEYFETDVPIGGEFGDVMSDPDENEMALFNENLYVNIHTMDFPAGELRGQIIPAPGALALIGLGGLAMTRRRR